MKMLPYCDGRSTTIAIKTLNGEGSEMSTAVNGLVARCINQFSRVYGCNSIDLPTAYIQKELPFGPSEVPTPEAVSRWQYLKEVTMHLSSLDATIPFGLLIGSNCAKALEPRDVVTWRAMCDQNSIRVVCYRTPWCYQ